jgi:hypothetical protein
MATTTRRAKSGRVNKSAWIRALPHSMPAKEVVDKAKSEGIKLSIAQVYTTRSSAKKAGKRGPGGARRGRPPAAASGGNDQLLFRRLVLSIGLPKAEAYLNELRRSVGL